jgi:Ser/Thr protein kinase RdoA (MazF antagonist)/AraC-like DNA-binding protein
MNAKELQTTMDYIDHRLCSDFLLIELSNQVGYSVIHLQRLFKQLIGTTLKEYIIERKLRHAIYDISTGENMLETALKYGFESHSGFYRAFRNRFGCSPRKYVEMKEVSYPKRLIALEEMKNMVTRKVILEALKSWDLDKYELDIESKVSHSDYRNVVIHLSDELMLKTGVNSSWMRNHINITKKLSDKGVSVPNPVKTKDGRDFIDNENRYYAILKKIKGTEFVFKDINADECKQAGIRLGEALGNLHIVLNEVDDTNVYEEDLHRQISTWALPNSLKVMKQWQYQVDDEFVEFIKEEVNKFSSLPKQIIHRDPNPSNLVLVEGEVVGFIDFEFSEINIRMFDLCYLSTGILVESLGISNVLERWLDTLKGLLQGYNSVNPITEDEFKSMFAIIMSIQLIFIAYLEDKPDLKDMAKDNRELFVLLWDNREVIYEAVIEIYE